MDLSAKFRTYRTPPETPRRCPYRPAFLGGFGNTAALSSSSATRVLRRSALAGVSSSVGAKAPWVATPLTPARILPRRKSQGATCRSVRYAECAVVQSAKPSFEKSHPGTLHFVLQSEVRWPQSIRTPAFDPSAFYVQAICSRGRILLRMDNVIAAGRDIATRRLAQLAGDTKSRYPGRHSRIPDITQRPRTPLPLGTAESPCSRD